MGYNQYIITAFLRGIEMNPGQLLPILAYASAVTLIIAVVTDALIRREPARQRRPDKK